MSDTDDQRAYDRGRYFAFAFFMLAFAVVFALLGAFAALVGLDTAAGDLDGSLGDLAWHGRTAAIGMLLGSLLGVAGCIAAMKGLRA